jgi:hypothetical protein
MTIVCTFSGGSVHPMGLRVLQGFTLKPADLWRFPGGFVSYTIAFQRQKLGSRQVLPAKRGEK